MAHQGSRMLESFKYLVFSNLQIMITNRSSLFHFLPLQPLLLVLHINLNDP